MRYVVATIGAGLIFLGVSFLWLLVMPLLPDASHIVLNLGFVQLRNPLMFFGLALAFFAGYHSFRSTLSRYEKKAAAESAPLTSDAEE